MDNGNGNVYIDAARENMEAAARENMELERSKWRGRRQMAWFALISMIIGTLLCMFAVPVERLKIIEELLSWYYLAASSVVGAYMGFTTWATISKK